MTTSAQSRHKRHDCRPRRAAGFGNERGVALVGVLLLTAAIFALGVFGTQSAQVELGIAGNDLRSEKALALAEAGAFHAFALLKNAGNTKFDTEVADGTGGNLTNLGSIVAVRGYNYRFRHVGSQTDDGYYVRMADNFDETGANDPTKDLDLKVAIVSRGLVGNAERVVSVGVQRAFAFPYAFFGIDYVKLAGWMTADSFDSRVAPYNVLTSGNMGNVRSNGNIEVNPALVKGDAVASGSVLIDNGGIVTGTATNGAPKLDFPSVSPCGPPYSDGTGISGTGTWKYTPSTGALTMSGTVTLAAGKYCFSSIKESSHGILKVDGPVEVYTTGEVDLTGDGINNTTGVASNFQLFSSYANSGSGIKIASKSSTYVAAYAPDTCVKTSGGADFYGSIVAKCIDATGGSGLHYDEALGSGITVGPPTLTTWMEERNF